MTIMNVITRVKNVRKVQKEVNRTTQRREIRSDLMVMPYYPVVDQVVCIPNALPADTEVVNFDEFLESTFYPRKRSDREEVRVLDAWLTYERENTIFRLNQLGSYPMNRVPDQFGPDESHAKIQNFIGGKGFEDIYDPAFGLKDKKPVNLKSSRVLNFTDYEITSIEPDNTRTTHRPIAFKKPSQQIWSNQRPQLNVVNTTMDNVDLLRSAGYLFVAHECGLLPNLAGKIVVIKHDRVVSASQHEASALYARKQEEIEALVGEDNYRPGKSIRFVTRDQQATYMQDFAYMYIIDPAQNHKAISFYSTRTNLLFYLGEKERAGMHPMFYDEGNPQHLDLSVAQMIKTGTANPAKDNYEMVKYQYVSPCDMQYPDLPYTKNDLGDIIEIPRIVDESYDEIKLRVTRVRSRRGRCKVITREYTQDQLDILEGFYPSRNIAQQFTFDKLANSYLQPITDSLVGFKETFRKRMEDAMRETLVKAEKICKSRMDNLRSVNQVYINNLKQRHEVDLKSVKKNASYLESEYQESLNQLKERSRVVEKEISKATSELEKFKREVEDQKRALADKDLDHKRQIDQMKHEHQLDIKINNIKHATQQQESSAKIKELEKGNKEKTGFLKVIGEVFSRIASLIGIVAGIQSIRHKSIAFNSKTS